MSRLRWILVAFAAIVLAVSLGQPGQSAFLQTQRDQIAVTIIVNVTPAPIVYRQGQTAPIRIAARMLKRARGSAGLSDASSLALGKMVAQTQSDVRVQAEVSPNPNATLLYSNVPAVTVNQTAGTTVTGPTCVYTVTVDEASSWTLKDGLSGDFITSTWPGSDLWNNTYLQGSTPQPASTPFVVYPSNNNTWNTKEAGSGMKTYCVTLTLTIPSSVPQGSYSTNAVYTLYF